MCIGLENLSRLVNADQIILDLSNFNQYGTHFLKTCKELEPWEPSSKYQEENIPKRVKKVRMNLDFYIIESMIFNKTSKCRL